MLPCIDFCFIPYADEKEALDKIEWFGSYNNKTGFNKDYSKSVQKFQAYIDVHWPKNIYYLIVSDIGIGPAIDVTLWIEDYNCKINGVSAGKERIFLLSLDFPLVEQNQSFKRTLLVSYEDVFGNEYRQQLLITAGDENIFYIDQLSNPKLTPRSEEPTADKDS